MEQGRCIGKPGHSSLSQLRNRSGSLAVLAAMRRASHSDFGSGGTLAAIHGRTPLPPHLLAIRFPQKKLFQDEFPIAGRKQSTANPARYLTVNARLRSGFGFDDLIKRVAMGALEIDCRGSDHDMSPCPDVSDAIYFPAPEPTNGAPPAQCPLSATATMQQTCPTWARNADSRTAANSAFIRSPRRRVAGTSMPRGYVCAEYCSGVRGCLVRR